MNIRKTILSAASFIAATMLFTSCSNSSMDLAKNLKKSYDNDGKKIEAKGKLDTGMFVWGTNDRTSIDMVLNITTALDNTKHESIDNVHLDYGAGKKNSVVINVKDGERKFSAKDVEIYDKDGNKLTAEDDVKITGTVTYTAKGPKKSSDTNNIPGIPKDKDDDGNDYSYKVTDVTIEKL